VPIIDAARVEFASRGFDGGSIAIIAGAADLGPGAVYHYFGSKVALYEEVFEATAEAMWHAVDEAALAHDRLLANMKSIIGFTFSMDAKRQQDSDFLALFPMECSLHPEFAHMLDWRSKRQDATFSALAELGIATGELEGFTVTTGTELLRSLIMGWFYESYIHGRPYDSAGESLITLIRLLGERSIGLEGRTDSGASFGRRGWLA